MNRWNPLNDTGARLSLGVRSMSVWPLVLSLVTLQPLSEAQVPLNASQFVGQPNGHARTFPATAKRGVMEVTNVHEVRINGTLTRLSPGSRIRSATNMLLTTGGLVGQTFLVNYTQDTLGQPHDIWILTEREAAEKRPGSEGIVTTNIITDGPR